MQLLKSRFSSPLAYLLSWLDIVWDITLPLES